MAVESDGAAVGIDVRGEPFEQWVRPHLAVLSTVAERLVGRADSADVVQEALLRAWRRRATYVAERGSARAWLIAIVVDQSRRAVRRRRLPRLTAEPVDEVPGALVDPAGFRVDVERAIATLPRRQQETVTLYYLADLPVAEVAVVLGVRVGTVKAHLAAARARLRQMLEDE